MAASAYCYYWAIIIGCMLVSIGVSLIMVPPFVEDLEEFIRESAFSYSAFIVNSIVILLCSVLMYRLPRKTESKTNFVFLLSLGIGSIAYFFCSIIDEGIQFGISMKTCGENNTCKHHYKVELSGTIMRNISIIITISMLIGLLSLFDVNEWSEIKAPRNSTFLDRLKSHCIYYIASFLISYLIVVFAYSFAEPALDMWFEYRVNTTEFEENCNKLTDTDVIEYLEYFLTPLYHEFITLGLTLLLIGSHNRNHRTLSKLSDVFLEEQEQQDTNEDEGIMMDSITIQNSGGQNRKNMTYRIAAILVTSIAAAASFVCTFIVLFVTLDDDTEFNMYHYSNIVVYLLLIVTASVGLFAPSNGLISKEFNQNPLNVEEYILLLMCGFECSFFWIKIVATLIYTKEPDYAPAALVYAILGVLQVLSQSVFLILSSREVSFCEKTVTKKHSWWMLTILMIIMVANAFRWMLNSVLKGTTEKDHLAVEPILETFFGCVNTKIFVIIFFPFLAFFRFHSAFMALELIIKYLNNAKIKLFKCNKKSTHDANQYAYKTFVT